MREIVKACVKYQDRLYTGFEHGECFNKLNEENIIIVFNKIEQGFIDSDGNFVDRKQAMVIAKEAGQLSCETDKQTLISEDLHLDWLKKQNQYIQKIELQLALTRGQLSETEKALEIAVDELDDAKDMLRVCGKEDWAGVLNVSADYFKIIAKEKMKCQSE